MVMYRVTKSDFNGKKENKQFKKGREYDFTIKRAEEINATLKKNYDIENNLERVKETKEGD